MNQKGFAIFALILLSAIIGTITMIAGEEVVREIRRDNATPNQIHVTGVTINPTPTPVSWK